MYQAPYLHLLTLSSNISRNLHNPLPPIRMLIQLDEKSFKNVMKPTPRRIRLTSSLGPRVAVVISLNATRHDEVGLFQMQEDDNDGWLTIGVMKGRSSD